MISLLRWVLRFLLRRFGWVAVAAAVRSLARHSGQRQIDEATDDVAAKLPDSAVTVLSDVPGDPLRVAGTAVAASRSARRAAELSRSVAGTTATPVRAFDRFRRSLATWGRSVGVSIGEERSSIERQLWSDYHRSRGDHARADSSMLDARPDSSDNDDATELWDRVPPQVNRGRMRSVPPADDRPRRARRRYQRPRRPWER